MNMREKQILTSVIEIQKENWGNHTFFKDNSLTIFVKSFKIQSIVLRSFISEKCMVTPNFLFRYEEFLLVSSAKFSASFKAGQDNP